MGKRVGPSRRGDLRRAVSAGSGWDAGEVARRDDQAIRRRLLSEEPNRAIERLHQEQARFRLSQALSGEMPGHLAGPYGRGASDLYLGPRIPLLISSSI